MMIRIFTISLLALVTLPLMSQMKNLSFKFNHTVDGTPMVLNKTIFSIHNGKKIKLTRADFYLSGVTLITDDKTSFKIDKSYILSRASEPDVVHPAGSFPENFDIKKIKMEVGIDQETNHADPSPYPASHPLGPKDPAMHWGWAGGYRFIALEGLVDNNNDGIPEQMFQFHGLGDELLFSAVLDMAANHQIGTEPMVINLDYVKLFQNISMSGNLIQHNSGTLNKSLLTNAATKGFISPAMVSSTNNVPFESLASFSQNNRELKIEFSNNDEVRVIVIYNQVGQLVKSEITNASVCSINLETAISGNYFISIKEGQSQAATKFLIY